MRMPAYALAPETSASVKLKPVPPWNFTMWSPEPSESSHFTSIPETRQ